MSPLLLFLLLGTPQNQPGSAQPNDVQAQAEQRFPLQAQHALIIQLQQHAMQNVECCLQRAPFEGANLCFAIRSYVFERQDGNAPVLVSTSTCTPASTIQRRQVANPLKPRLVPQ